MNRKPNPKAPTPRRTHPLNGHLRSALALSGAVLAMLLAAATPLRAQRSPDPDSPRWKGVVALRDFLGSRGAEAVDEFLRDKIAPSLRKQYGDEVLREELRQLRDDLSGTELQGAQPKGPYSAVVTFGNASGSNEAVIPFALEAEPPHRFVQIGPIGGEGGETGGGRGSRSTAEPLTWDDLADRMQEEAANGFSGVLLVARDGEIVFHEGYGYADREKKIPITPETIFAIGSTPIDFTRAGILLLAQRGKIELSDRITKYFRRVPPDKRAITIEHLMSGQSGLRDFLGRPSDSNPDHTWIDRQEAIKRIFEDSLLFAPGKGQRHSHAAWGLLAAIIEIVSEQTYPEFTRQHLLEPAGMKDTGFFGEKYPVERMAIGYGDRGEGEVNAPPYWGPTSWLVMGSGGQTSTTGDMYRWHRALASGAILEGDFLAQYWSPRGSILAGGDMFGFEIRYTQGPETMMVVISNAGGPGRMPRLRTLGLDLTALVGRGAQPKFSLGIMMNVQNDHVSIERVIEGSAAQRDGLLQGDVLLAAGGRALGEDPLVVLDELLETGAPIVFDVERSGARHSVTVKPDPR